MADPASNSPVAYLREVRRARARFAKDPAALGQHLRQLNRARDLEVPTRPSAGPRPDVAPRARAPRAADPEPRARQTPVRPSSAPHQTGTPAVQHVDVRRKTVPVVDAASVQAPPQHPAGVADALPRSPRPPAATRPGVLGVPRDVADAFVLEIEAAIEGGLLRYTARRRLLARAGRLGIGPFDANLLIASVLHHEARTPAAQAAEPRRAGLGTWVVAVLAVEVIAVLTWAIFG